jgi:hypothetical protein
LRAFIISIILCLAEVSAARAAPTAANHTAHDEHIVALRATLARANIRLELRGREDVIETSDCKEVDDADQPNGCFRCVLADDTDIGDAALARMTAALDLYPTELLAEAKIATFALCGLLENVASRTRPHALSDVGERRLLINLSSDDLEASIHHELFHMLEAVHFIYFLNSDERWEDTNPIGFSYSWSVPPNYNPNTRPDGFIRWYGTTDASEDRATVYEHMIADPMALCVIAMFDPVVRAKAQIIWSRITLLGRGDDFMNHTESCVRELAAPEPWKRERWRVDPSFREALRSQFSR